MGKNEKTFIQKAVILPLLAALLTAAVAFSVFPAVKNLIPLAEGSAVLSAFENQKAGSEFVHEGRTASGTVKKNEIGDLQPNTEVGIITIGSSSVSLIYAADSINIKDSASLLEHGNYIGETGCAYIYGYKSVLGDINNMKAGDKILVNTLYGEYIFSVTDVALKSGESTVLTADPDTERGLIIYTNTDNGAGISSTYCVVTAEMVSGPAVEE